ncbi:NADPH:quinone reductase-like Zn-dependent oxidoreductase [Rhodococcus sp. LBL1]|nr:NADPH:quinone reductase-like Zn-dependent oxidoreductase [Rhodococcus sp. LBL1]MDH6685432.1 NADPH:quinone reductase-like Zn-dependent oxidoreductase [Rhodococcus sp. LBL2]
MTLAITYPANDREPADLFDVTEIADPPAPGLGQIQIDVRAFPIHPGDLHLMPPAPGHRAVAGLEATGVVAEVGPGVRTHEVGRRVTVFPNPGSWAQKINVAAELAVPVPDSLADDVAAQMVCNPLTALLLHRAAQQHFTVGFDGIVINNAANSSVGRLFTAWAEHRGVDTISVVRSRRGAEQLAARYPGVPVVSTDKDEWVDGVRAIAGRRPISVALDPVGGEGAADLMSVLAPGGTLVAYGALAQGGIPLHASALLGNEIGLRGLSIGRWLTGIAPERRASDIAAAAALVAMRPSELEVAGTYSLGQISDAVHHVSRAGKIGTVVVRTQRELIGT